MRLQHPLTVFSQSSSRIQPMQVNVIVCPVTACLQMGIRMGYYVQLKLRLSQLVELLVPQQCVVQQLM
jgi:hypothetical protein